MKKMMALGIAVIMMIGVVGCGNKKVESTDPVKETDSVTDEVVDKTQTLLIYSNAASDGRGEWLVEKAANEGYKIEVVNIQGSDLTNRLIGEKNNSLADLVYGLNTLEYEKLKQEELLLKYEPTWASEVDMSLGDAEGYYYPIVVQPLVLISSPEYKDAPNDWLELANDPKYKDQYNIFALGGGTGKTVFSSILVRYADPNGELGISEEGWEVAKNYIQNAHIEIKGEDYIGAAIDGSRPMTMMWGSGVIQNQDERDFKFSVMSPEVGVPFVTEQVGIISKTDKAALAKDFANWFGSAEIQEAWSAEFGTIPAHPEALEAATPDVKELMGTVHAQNIDWALVAKNIDAWVEKAELEFVQ